MLAVSKFATAKLATRTALSCLNGPDDSFLRRARKAGEANRATFPMFCRRPRFAHTLELTLFETPK
jgi:hypothetical protein